MTIPARSLSKIPFEPHKKITAQHLKVAPTMVGIGRPRHEIRRKTKNISVGEVQYLQRENCISGTRCT
jgi:hypothetical protein